VTEGGRRKVSEWENKFVIGEEKFSTEEESFTKGTKTS